MAEIVKCPSCTKPLQIPESYFGQTVQCPQCQHRFVAQSSAVSSTPPPTPPPPSAHDDETPPRRSRYDEDELDDVSPRISRRLAPHRGGLIIALGIISLAVPCAGIICGPMAWVMGNADMAEIRAGRMDPAGEGMVQAGRILGVISTILIVLMMLFYCLIFGIAILGA